MRRWIFAALMLTTMQSQAGKIGVTDPIGGNRVPASEALPSLPPWLPAPAPEHLDAVVARVDDASCEVYVERGGIKFRVGKLPASLFRGDIIHCKGTSATQELRIGLRSGTQIKMNRETTIRIAKYQSEERDAAIDLTKGSLSLLVRPGDNLELNTPAGTMGSQAAEFEVLAATKDIDGLVRTIQGEVWVRGKRGGESVGTERTVRAWSMVRVKPNGEVSEISSFGR
jgi:hypothetical protein